MNRPAKASEEPPRTWACGVCGTTAEDRPVTWSMQVSSRGTQWICASCTRDNVRAIEGRLDEAWW